MASDMPQKFPVYRKTTTHRRPQGNNKMQYPRHNHHHSLFHIHRLPPLPMMAQHIKKKQKIKRQKDLGKFLRWRGRMCGAGGTGKMDLRCGAQKRRAPPQIQVPSHRHHTSPSTSKTTLAFFGTGPQKDAVLSQKTEPAKRRGLGPEGCRSYFSKDGRKSLIVSFKDIAAQQSYKTREIRRQPYTGISVSLCRV